MSYEDDNEREAAEPEEGHGANWMEVENRQGKSQYLSLVQLVRRKFLLSSNTKAGQPCLARPGICLSR